MRKYKGAQMLLTEIVDCHDKRSPEKTGQEIVESKSEDWSRENLLPESEEEDNCVGEDGKDPPDKHYGNQHLQHCLLHRILLAVDVKVVCGFIVTSLLWFLNFKELFGGIFLCIEDFIVGYIVVVKEAFGVVLL